MLAESAAENTSITPKMPAPRAAPNDRKRFFIVESQRTGEK
jgi:hypothetical protein